MNSSVDVLILSASFGMGHNSVSDAIKAQIMEKNPNQSVKIVDLFDIIAPSSKDSFVKTYDFLTSKMSIIYNLCYYFKKDFKDNPFDYPMYLTHSKDFAKYLETVNPKLIVSTFPMSSGFVSRAKAKYNVNVPMITVVTDVVDSYEWLHDATDRYLVPTTKVRAKLVKKGVHPDNIKVTGIPVKKEFLTSVSEKGDKKQILIMASVMDKLGIDETFLKRIDETENLKTVIVTGSNKRLYEELNEYNFTNIEILGYTNEVAKLMEESDLLVTKPGGVTLFEAIHKEIPLVLKKSNVGQEMYNVKFIRENDIGVFVDKKKNLYETLMDTIHDHRRLDTLKGNINSIRNEIEAQKVGDYMLELM